MNIMKSFKAFLALFLICALAACSSTPKQESSGEYFDDSVLTTKVKAAILNTPGLSSAEINVETFKRVVQLSGFVKTQADIEHAVKVAAGVKGVKAVNNDMRLK